MDVALAKRICSALHAVKQMDSTVELTATHKLVFNNGSFFFPKWLKTPYALERRAPIATLAEHGVFGKAYRAAAIASQRGKHPSCIFNSCYIL